MDRLNDLAPSPLPCRLEIISIGSAPALAWVAGRFGIAHGIRVHHMGIIRYVMRTGDEPFPTTTICHPRELGTLVRRSDFQSEFAQAQWAMGIVEAKCKLRVTTVLQTVSAKLADSTTSGRLEFAVGESLLEAIRHYIDATYRAGGRDRARYVLRIGTSTF